MKGREYFVQHLLSQDQLRAGLLADIDDIQIPEEPIAMTACSAIELERRCGITFQKSFDDLDSGDFAVLEFTGGFTVILKDYYNSPVKGVRIYTDPEGSRSRERLAVILNGLRLSSEELTWIAPSLLL